MNAREFYDTVKAMRENQRNYLLTKQNRYLSELKRLEHIIDAEIIRVDQILKLKQQ
jgi:CHASE3 domain sensor protein